MRKDAFFCATARAERGDHRHPKGLGGESGGYHRSEWEACATKRTTQASEAPMGQGSFQSFNSEVVSTEVPMPGVA